MREIIVNNNSYAASMISRTGGRKENQDHCMGHSLRGSDQSNILLLSVCDGMGGLAGGKTASRIAVETIDQVVTSKIATIAQNSDDGVLDILREAIEKANAAIFKRSLDDEVVRGMGTTTATMLITPRAAYIAHVGDSRCYILRKSKKVFRTFDHSRVFELVKMGVITEEEARTSGNANIISKALGIKKVVDVELQMAEYRKGDRIIICCDGIWNTMPEDQLIRLFCKCEHNEDATDAIANEVDRLGKESGLDYDNLSVIVADMKVNSNYKTPFSQKFSELIKNINIFHKKK